MYQGVFSPRDALSLVCVGVREAVYLTGLSTEEAVEVGADLVSFACGKIVTLGATGLESVLMKRILRCVGDGYLEEVGTFLVITCRKQKSVSCHRHQRSDRRRMSVEPPLLWKL